MTLAAGAAHELSTPLGTIAVAARELERASSGQGPASLVDDARLIRTEVDRCQFILSRLSGRAGSGIPDEAALLPPAALARRAAEGLPATQRQRLQIRVAEELLQPSADPEAADAVSSLLKNAFDASHPESPVVLRIEPRGPMLRIEVHDQGSGMSDEVMRRAGEPFFTTKDAGRGLGLGVFLARTFAERLGGTLWFERRGGTLAIHGDPAHVTSERTQPAVWSTTTRRFGSGSSARCATGASRPLVSAIISPRLIRQRMTARSSRWSICGCRDRQDFTWSAI